MKRSIFATLFILSAAALAPVSSQAADPAKVHEYVTVMGMQKMMMDIIPSLVANMAANLKQSNPNLPSDATEIVTKTVTDIMTPLLPQMMAANEKIYAENLTDEEVTGAIAFYKSPVGQSLLKKTPAMMQQGMQASHAIIAAHIPELQQRIIQELHQRHPEMK